MRYISTITTSLTLATVIALAAPSYAAKKLYSPYVEKGELELEYFGSRTNDSDATKDNKQKHQIAVGYGVNDWWRTEIYAKYARDAQTNTKFDAWEWENIFQISQRGEYWLDVGAALAYEYTPKRDIADKIEGRVLLAKDIQKTSHIMNLILEKEVGSGPKAHTEGVLLWSSRYNLYPYFEPGFEISSDFGELDDMGTFDEQQHYIGPAAYGKIPLHLATNSDALKYRVGYLFGVSDAASTGDALLQLEYELHF